MKIEVFSVKSFTGNALKHQLESALAAHHLPFTVTENNNVDDFIKEGISSVPSVRIGDTVIEHQENGNFNVTIQKTLDVLMGDRDLNILVPVDFSPESIHALRYARMMAAHLNMGITAVHVHQPLYDPITGTAFDLEMMEKNKERLEEMVIGIGWDGYRTGMHVPVTAHFETGDVSSQLVHLVQDDKYAMIIMSTRAEESFTRRLLGSVSTTVGRVGSKPVIIVPSNSHIKFPAKMVVGMTGDLLHGKALEIILTFATEHDVFVDFILATNDQEHFAKLKKLLQERLAVHPKELSGYNIRSVAYVKDEVHHTLTDYSLQVNADILAVVTIHRNFLERLRHTSITKKILYHPSLPVMVIHADDQPKA